MYFDFFTSHIPDEIKEIFGKYSAKQIVIMVIITIVFFAIILALYIGLLRLLMFINKSVIRHIEKKKGKSITLQFIEKAVSIAIIVYFIIIPLGGDEIARTLLGSTAVVAAIVGFAAQDAIKDIFAGLQISIYKPFDVGSRIEFEDGTGGIVESITLRHIVLRMVDTTRAIVPNSRANSMKIVNYSFGDVPRSVLFKFPISYDSDVEKAKKVIRETICSCPYTLNNDNYKEEELNSRSVYFLELDDSSLVMAATVLYPPTFRSEVIKDEINTSVFRAFNENGIEVPYEHIDVKMRS